MNKLSCYQKCLLRFSAIETVIFWICFKPDSAGCLLATGAPAAAHHLMCMMCGLSPALLRPHGLQPARLPCPWTFPGKNIGLLSLTCVEWHLVDGACLMSVGDETTPCLSQLAFALCPCLVHALDTRGKKSQLPISLCPDECRESCGPRRW